MFQIAQPIWNDIEKLEDLKYNLTRVLFSMDGEEIDEKLEDYDLLEMVNANLIPAVIVDRGRFR